MIYKYYKKNKKTFKIKMKEDVEVSESLRAVSSIEDSSTQSLRP